jgi:hypothetical protein
VGELLARSFFVRRAAFYRSLAGVWPPSPTDPPSLGTDRAPEKK